MRILVLGGTGFIGPFVVRRLVALGHDVTVFHRGQSTADLPPVRHVLGDRTRLADLARELCGPRPDVVIDMFAFTQADARGVQEVFASVASRLVVISSQDVYLAYGRLHRTEPGPPQPVPLGEDAALREQFFVDGPEWEKILVEREALAATALPATVLRLPMVYGPGDSQHRLFPYLKRIADGRPAILLDEGWAQWRWSRGYVENVAEAIAAAAVDERARGRVYNVAEPEAPAEAEWVRWIAVAAGWNGRIVVVPREKLPEHLRLDLDTRQHWMADTTRIREELGHREVVDADEAMRRTVEWERTHPPERISPRRFDYAAEDEVLASL